MLGGEPMTVGMREMQERLHLFGPVKWHKSSIPACQLHEQCRKCLTRVEVVARTDEVCIIGEALLGKEWLGYCQTGSANVYHEAVGQRANLGKNEAEMRNAQTAQPITVGLRRCYLTEL